MADVGYVKPGDVPANFWSSALKASSATGVDPYLLAAISKQETMYGTQGAGRDGYSLGYGYPGPGQGMTQYQDQPGSFDVQTMAAAKQIKAYMGDIPVTAISLQDLSSNSWKAVDPTAWAKGVWSNYKSLNGNIDPILNWGSDPGGAANDLKNKMSGGAAQVASGITYFVAILVIIGIALFSAVKMFSDEVVKG